MGNLRLDMFHLDTTRAGWLSGSPEDLGSTWEDWACDSALKMIEHVHGEGRPVHIVRDGAGKLRYTCTAELVGPAPAGSDELGTYLFLVWFADRPPEDPLLSAIARVGNKWDELSRSFSY